MKKTINKEEFTSMYSEVMGDLLTDKDLSDKGMLILLVGTLFHSKLKQKLFDTNEELEIID